MSEKNKNIIFFITTALLVATSLYFTYKRVFIDQNFDIIEEEKGDY
ncbi:MAG: hypothetical protein ACOYMZ_01765 [Minisyncoccia bacterium]